MSNTPSPASTKKWGSFLQQAVAGVESKLDDFLANDEAAANSATHDSQQLPTREASTRQSQPSARPNKSILPHQAPPRSRLSNQVPTEASSSTSSLPDTKQDATDTASLHDPIDLPPNPNDTPARVSSEERHSSQHEAASISAEERIFNNSNKVTESAKHSQETKSLSDGPSQPSLDDKVHRSEVEQLKAEHQEAESRWREDLHGYIERIDSLQSKLKYLSEDAVQSARSSASSAEPDSLERKVYEKEERIAALMEEGQKLSKLDFDNREAIKKYRRTIVEQERADAEKERQLEDAQRQLSQTRDAVSRLEKATRRDSSRLSSLAKTEQELASTREGQKSLQTTVADLKRQLSLANTRANDAQRKAQTGALEAERREKVRLEEDLSSARIERELSENKLRKEIEDLRAALEKVKQHSQALEAEILRERLDSEKKMELLRSQAEELSSAAGTDEQAKQLRQIDTLQSQYSVALDNWRVTEEYLLTRVANVEKERDELLHGETELRKKLRATNAEAKIKEDRLGDCRADVLELERKLESSQHEFKKMQQKLAGAEKELNTTKDELSKHKQNFETILHERLEDERASFQQSMSSTPFNLTEPDFSGRSTRKSSVMAHNAPMRPCSPINSVRHSEGGMLRHSRHLSSSSNLALARPVSLDANEGSSLAIDLSNVHPLEEDATEKQPPSPSTFTSATNDQNPRPDGTKSRNGSVNGTATNSTAAGGPSVQLVERMSATVRRLESQRIVSKDEVSRLTSQRDEARNEVVSLMHEVQEKRRLDERVKEVEAELEDLDRRHQTTLEMLGEKSERVTELEADVVDLKGLYRQLADTMK